MKWKLVSAVVLVGVASLLTGRCTSFGRQAQFVMGGALVDVGYGLQDGIESYDFEHHHEITPEQVWEEMLEHNRLSSGMRSRFPRTARHPLVALLVCMDARIDTNELVGDTRRYYHVIRTAGSVMSEREVEMLELAVENGVKLVVLTTHSDCAAEKAAASAEMRQRFPALGRAVDEREKHVAEFLGRPAIAAATARGDLAVKRIAIETLTDQLVER
jgi:carbonic anhydrase